jgi:hypothetical protein
MRFRRYRRQWLTFALGVTAGLLVWLGSTLLFGTEEPWDAEGFRYFGVVLGLGAALGVLSPDRFWVGPCGIYVGQFAFGMAAWLKSILGDQGGGVNFFIPLGAVFLVWSTVPSLAGAFVAARIVRVRS